jgi:HPt (histidine-containing phosphotransfer) domain-containing protein
LEPEEPQNDTPKLAPQKLKSQLQATIGSAKASGTQFEHSSEKELEEISPENWPGWDDLPELEELPDILLEDESLGEEEFNGTVFENGTTSREPVVDAHIMQSFRELYDDEPEEWLTLIQDFLGDGEQHLEAMGNSITNSDVPALQEAAHTLKSSSASMGAFTFSEFCKELEYMARADLENQVNPPECLTSGRAVRVFSQAQAEWKRVRDVYALELQAQQAAC